MMPEEKPQTLLDAVFSDELPSNKKETVTYILEIPKESADVISEINDPNVYVTFPLKWIYRVLPPTISLFEYMESRGIEPEVIELDESLKNDFLEKGNMEPVYIKATDKATGIIIKVVFGYEITITSVGNVIQIGSGFSDQHPYTYNLAEYDVRFITKEERDAN